MKLITSILINKPFELDKEENVYVGIFFEINIGGLFISLNDSIFQMPLYIYHIDDGTIKIEIGNEVFTALSGTTYIEFDDEDDEDYNEYTFNITDVTRLFNYVLYELEPTEENYDEDDEQYSINYVAPNPQNIQTLLKKIKSQEKITQEDVKLLVNNINE
jgi:hypothetical protein